MSRPKDEPEPWRNSKRAKRFFQFTRACQRAIDRGVNAKQIFRLLRQRREADTRLDRFDIAQRLYQIPEIKRVP